MKKSLRILEVIVFYVILLFSISCTNDPPIIPPKAEITDIYSITNNSVSIDVQVTQQSNAQSGTLILILDSVTNNNKYLVEEISLDTAVNAQFYPLKNKYTAQLANLKSKTQYNIYLHYGGLFDLGGPNGHEEFIIGEAKFFTTQ